MRKTVVQIRYRKLSYPLLAAIFDQVITSLYRDMIGWQISQRKIAQDMMEAWVHLTHLKGVEIFLLFLQQTNKSTD